MNPVFYYRNPSLPALTIVKMKYVNYVINIHNYVIK